MFYSQWKNIATDPGGYGQTRPIWNHKTQQHIPKPCDTFYIDIQIDENNTVNSSYKAHDKIFLYLPVLSPQLAYRKQLPRNMIATHFLRSIMSSTVMAICIAAVSHSFNGQSNSLHITVNISFLEKYGNPLHFSITHGSIVTAYIIVLQQGSWATHVEIKPCVKIKPFLSRQTNAYYRKGHIYGHIRTTYRPHCYMAKAIAMFFLCP